MYIKPRGTNDIYGTDLFYWRFIEDNIKDICENYNYQEIRTPMFENYNLFKRTSGEFTDVVQKEIYDFYDKGGRHIALKPESTAAVVRSFLENKLWYGKKYSKFFYISPHFRYERQQLGRYRQHHQFGVEVFGEENLIIDLEIITLAINFFKKIGLNNIKILINNLGNIQTRSIYKKQLKKYFYDKKNNLCDCCKNRFDNNILRILDCKEDSNKNIVKNAPSIKDFLDKDHIYKTNTLISQISDRNIEVIYDDKLIRGLDYYSGIVFEIILNHNVLKNISICGGGRYDKLIFELGGDKNISGIGFGIGIERLILSLKHLNIKLKESKKRKIYVANISKNKNAIFYCYSVVEKLRCKFQTDFNYEKKTIRNILNKILKENFTDLIIIGDEEYFNNKVTHKNLIDKKEEKINFADLLDYLGAIYEY